MNTAKFVLSCAFLIAGFSSMTFSAAGNGCNVEIIVLEDPTLIHSAPFTSHLHVFEQSPLENGDDLKEHGMT